MQVFSQLFFHFSYNYPEINHLRKQIFCPKTTKNSVFLLFLKLNFSFFAMFFVVFIVYLCKLLSINNLQQYIVCNLLIINILLLLLLLLLLLIRCLRTHIYTHINTNHRKKAE